MKVKELIKILSEMDENLNIFVRQEEDYTGDDPIDYYALERKDITVDYVNNAVDDKEYKAMLIGDGRI